MRILTIFLLQGGGEKLPEAFEEPSAASAPLGKRRKVEGGNKGVLEDKPKTKPSRSEQRRQKLKKGQKMMTLE